MLDYLFAKKGKTTLVSLAAKLKEIVDWKHNKSFVPKHFGCIAQLSSIESVWLHSCHMILGWSGDRKSGTWMFGFPSPASSWLKEEHLVSISTASLILLSRELSCKSIILTRFLVRFPLNHLLFRQNYPISRTFLYVMLLVNSAQLQRWLREEKIQKVSGNLISKTNTLNCSTNFVKLDCFIDRDCHDFDVVRNTHTKAHLIQSISGSV